MTTPIQLEARRKKIDALERAGMSNVRIAAVLRVSPRTICRDLYEMRHPPKPYDERHDTDARTPVLCMCEDVREMRDTLGSWCARCGAILSGWPREAAG